MRKTLDGHLDRLSKPAALPVMCPLWESFHQFRLRIVRKNALRHSAIFFEVEKTNAGRRASDRW